MTRIVCQPCGAIVAHIETDEEGLLLQAENRVHRARHQPGEEGQRLETLTTTRNLRLTPEELISWSPEDHQVELPCHRCGARLHLMPDHPDFRRQIGKKRPIVIQ